MDDAPLALRAAKFGDKAAAIRITLYGGETTMDENATVLHGSRNASCVFDGNGHSVCDVFAVVAVHEQVFLIVSQRVPEFVDDIVECVQYTLPWAISFD